MKTKPPYTPPGYTGQNFNGWQKHIQKEIDKIRKTNLAGKL